MAQINITLNQDEILQLMATDREGAFKKLLQESLNSFLQAESTYFKVREDRKIISKALMVAYAVNNAGIREVVGFGVYKNES